MSPATGQRGVSAVRTRFESTIALHARGDTVLRDPTFWDKVKRVFGRKPDLDTQRVRTHLTTAHLVGGARHALERMGVKNALALVIDGHVLFEDHAGVDDDFDDMFLAFYENESVHGRDFRELRLTVEHLEAGLHLVIAIVAHGVHERDEATASVIVTADRSALPIAPALAWAQRRQFEAFVLRVRDGLRDALPDVRVSAPVEPRPERDDARENGVVGVDAVDGVHDVVNELRDEGADEDWDAPDEHGGGLVGELD